MTAGQVTLRTTDKRHVLTAWLGPNEPALSGGVGGWSAVQRPRKPAVVEWVGTDPIEATLELLLDSYRAGTPVSGPLGVARVLAPLRPVSEPPVFTVSGHPSIPPVLLWTAQGLALSGWELRRDGQPLRVTATFSLIEHRLGDTVTRSSPAKRSSSRNSTSRTTKGKPHTYTVRRGDTLGGIAARLLGSASKASTLAKANGIRDYNHLKVGLVLKIPS